MPLITLYAYAGDADAYAATLMAPTLIDGFD